MQGLEWRAQSWISQEQMKDSRAEVPQRCFPNQGEETKLPRVSHSLELLYPFVSVLASFLDLVLFTFAGSKPNTDV